MFSKARFIFLLGITLVLILIGVFSTPKVSMANPPSDYRVPLIGWYKITRMDRVAGCDQPNYPRHEGIGRFLDISGSEGGDTDRGDPVYAAGPGTVTLGSDGNVGYGNYVLLESNGVTFRYAHLDKVHVQDKKTVQKGSLLGFLGDTGNSDGAHLHWEAWLTDGVWGNTGFNIFSIPEVDANHTPCIDDLYDSINGEPLPSNSATSCAMYGALFQNFPHVALFDDDHCQGNPKMLASSPSQSVRTNLNDVNFNDRTRSIYVPNGWAVIAGEGYFE